MLGRGTDEMEISLGTEHIDIAPPIEFDIHRTEDEVKGTAGVGHRGLILRIEKVMGSESFRFLLLIRAGGNRGDFATPLREKL